MRGFFQGVAAFSGGVRWVVSTPQVWPRAMVPGATALVLVAALAVGGFRGALAFAHRTSGNGFGAGLLGVLLAVAGVALAIVVGVSLAQPLSGWALDGIVRARERDLGIDRAAELPRFGMMLRSLACTMLGLAAAVPLFVLLTLVGWVFPPAALITVPLKVLIAAMLLAWDLLDYPLALHGVSLAARLHWCAHNFGAVLGFGLAATLLFAVPGFGLLALPCGVAGAARLTAEA